MSTRESIIADWKTELTEALLIGTRPWTTSMANKHEEQANLAASGSCSSRRYILFDILTCRTDGI